MCVTRAEIDNGRHTRTLVVRRVKEALAVGKGVYRDCIWKN